MGFLLPTLLLSIAALCFIAVGLRLLSTGKPFLLHSRWRFVPLGFSFGAAFTGPFGDVFRSHIDPVYLPFLFMCAGLGVFLFRRWRGYTVYGIDGEPLRIVLRQALESLHLPFTERPEAFVLPEQKTTLHIHTAHNTGTTELHMDDDTKMREIAATMRKVLASNRTPSASLSGWLFILIGGSIGATIAIVGRNLF